MLQEHIVLSSFIISNGNAVAAVKSVLMQMDIFEIPRIRHANNGITQTFQSNVVEMTVYNAYVVWIGLNSDYSTRSLHKTAIFELNITSIHQINSSLATTPKEFALFKICCDAFT